MDLEEAVDRLQKSRAGWDCFGVAALFTFGSVATGLAQNDPPSPRASTRAYGETDFA
jgi:hypothetical protein